MNFLEKYQETHPFGYSIGKRQLSKDVRQAYFCPMNNLCVKMMDKRMKVVVVKGVERWEIADLFLKMFRSLLEKISLQPSEHSLPFKTRLISL